MENNIYTRIGQVLESTGLIDAVLAYDADEEKVLTEAGFIRCGSTMVNGDIVDIYKKTNERRIFQIDISDISEDDKIKVVEKVKSYLHQGHDSSIYYKQKLIDAAYNPLSILEDYFFPVTKLKETDKPYLTNWSRNMENKNDKK